MRRRHYPGLTTLGFYGVTSLPLIGSKGTLTAMQVTSETLCRVASDPPRLEWAQLIPPAPPIT